MYWWFWMLVLVYALGFMVTFVGHVIFLQMVTPGLALLRAFVWPFFAVTGRPRGQPLRMG